MHHLFGSYKRFGMVLVGLAILLSIPITISLLKQQQDLRQRAAETQTPVISKVADLDGSLDFGGGTLSGGGCIGSCGGGGLGTPGGDSGGGGGVYSNGGGTGSSGCPAGTTQCGNSCYLVNGCSGTVACDSSGLPVCNTGSTANNNTGGSTCPSGSVSCSGGCYSISSCTNGYTCTAVGIQCNAAASPTPTRTPTRTPTPAPGNTGGGSCPGSAVSCGSNCYDVSACPNGYSCQSSGAVCNAGSSSSNDTNATGLTGSSGGATCTVDNSNLAMDSAEQQFVTLVNQYRQQNNLPAVDVSTNLTRDAAWMAKDMGDHNNFSHTDTLGRSWDTRATACGYPGFAADIVATGTVSDPQATLITFKNSPGHNKVLLDHIDGTDAAQNWKSMGVARYKAANGTWWWAAAFGNVDDPGNVPTIAPTSPTPTTHPTAVPTQLATPTHSQTTTTPIPATPTAAPNSGNVATSLTLPGIGSNTGAGENSNPISATRVGYIQWINGNNQPTTAQAIFAFNNLVLNGTTSIPAGTYTIKAKTDNSLWKTLGNVTVVSGQNTSLPTASLVSGDINQDNILNLLDYNIFISCYGNKSCDQKTQSDFNMDGKVDEKDLNIFYVGLAKRNGD